MNGDEQGQSTKARVLVVEDEFFIAHEIADVLEAANFEVIGPCPSVQKALAQLDAGPCDVAILDVSLKNETSIPVVQALTQRGIPFVVLTGFSQSQLPPEMASASMLSKPLNADILIRELQRLLTSQ